MRKGRTKKVNDGADTSPTTLTVPSIQIVQSDPERQVEPIQTRKTKGHKSRHTEQIHFDDFFDGHLVSPYSIPHTRTVSMDEVQHTGNVDLDAECSPVRDKPVILFVTSATEATVDAIGSKSTLSSIPDSSVSDVVGRRDGRGQGDSPKTPDHQISRLSAHERAAQTSLIGLIRGSREETAHFVSFQRRLGTNIYSKYCGEFNLNANILLFLHVVYGLVQCNIGVFAIVHKPVEYSIGFYMLFGGILNSLIFPILIMEWSHRIGGCLEEGQKVETNIWWPIILTIKIIYCITGTVVIVNRYPTYRGQTPDPRFVKNQEFIICGLVYTVCDWALVVLVIFLPIACLCCLYTGLKANRHKSHSLEVYVEPVRKLSSGEERDVEVGGQNSATNDIDEEIS